MVVAVDAPAIAPATPDALLVATPPVDAAPDGGHTLLTEANQARADQRWQDVHDLAQRVLDGAPANAAAKELLNRAATELANQASYQKLTQQLAAGQLAAALSSYRPISEDSVYYARAKQAIANARRQFVAETRTRAQRLATQHQCAELKRLAIEAGNVTTEATAATDLPCTDATTGPTRSRQAIEGSKTAAGGGPADEPANVVSDAPGRLDRTMIAEGLARMKARVMSCGDELELKGQVKVSVKVAPDGHVTSVSMKDTVDSVLGDCVLHYLKKATFAKTQTGGTFSYSYNF